MGLIDVNALMDGKFPEVENEYQLGWNDALTAAYQTLEERVEYAPIEYAEWIPDEYAFNRCSKCGWEWDEAEYKTPFCPHCGARMEDVEDERQ